MKVRCVGNAVTDLDDREARATYSESIHQDQVDLVVGAEYVVYGIGYRRDSSIPWYLVCEDDEDEYPTPHLGAFFEVVEGDIPAGWKFTATPGNAGDTAVLPAAWAANPRFLEDLIDGSASALAEFGEMRRLARTR